MMQLSFEKLVDFYRLINFDDNSRQGVLTVIHDEAVGLVGEVLSIDADETGLQILNGDINNLQVGSSLELEVGDPRISLGIVATNIDDFLRAPKARIKEPHQYFVINENFYISDENIPELIVRYRTVLKVLSLFREAAAYLDETSGSLIYIHDGKYEIPVQYNASILIKMDMISAGKLLDLFDINAHKDQKLTILAKSIQSTCNSARPKERFTLLLEHLPDLLKSFTDGYRLFVADFSYEKIVNQIEVAKLEEIGKIHKTFSDIQNQILGIPVATIIVATQMKYATTVDYSFWVNTSVLIGCWIFAILGFFVLRNQLHTLNAIGTEIDRKKQQMLKDYKSIEDLITKSFPILEERLSTQRSAFYAVIAILGLGLIGTHIVYLILTGPAYIWLSSAYFSLHQFLANIVGYVTEVLGH